MSESTAVAAVVPPLDVIRRFRAHDFSLADFLASRIEARPAEAAIEFEGQEWSYAQLGRRVAQWDAWLCGRGVVAGDRIAIMSLNQPNTVALLFAVARLGAILVPVNPDYGIAEAAYVLGHAGASGVIASQEKQATIRAALEQQQLDSWAQDLDAALDAELDAQVIGQAGNRADAGQACLIIYTSGTTGFPKGAMHSQRSFVLTAEAFVERLWLQPDERVMCVMPMFHINALMYSVGGAIACGGTLVLLRKFSASTFWETAARTRATQVNLVAAAGSILAQRPRSEFDPRHTLCKMFVAPQTRAMVDALRDELGVPVLIECYGMTEIPGVISNPFQGPHKLGTMGILCKHPDPAIERPAARIVDDDGLDVPAGTAGELLIRTPTMMLGYYRDAAQTASAFLDGWFRTGDLVTQEADGYFRFVARKKDIIRRRGENIASAEVERIIELMPNVAEVAVIGVPSELGEEDILAAIVARPRGSIQAADVAAWTRERLAAVKAPRYVAFVDAIPHTATHKPAKHRLKEDAALLRNATDLQQTTTRTKEARHPMNEYCARAIEAMDPSADGADEALQKRMAIVLKHLHALIDELRPTDKELYQAMEWLNQVGRDGDFIMLCDVLGLTMRTVDLTHENAGATPANVEGPFANVGEVPVYECPVEFAAPHEPGQRLELRGVVRSAVDGAPLAGADFEIWQTNHSGKYENEDEHQPDNNFRGQFRTRQDGSYSVTTILPGAYEIGSLHSAVGKMMARLGRKRFRAPHLHYKVTYPGHEPLISQIYFDGQPENPTDCIFSPRPEITTAPRPHPDRPDHQLSEFDIRLPAVKVSA